MDEDWRERHREVHTDDGEPGMRLGLVNDGLRELWFPEAHFGRWVELTRGIVQTRGEPLPSWIMAFDEGRGPFRRRGLRLVMDPVVGRALPEILPMVGPAEGEVLELAIGLFVFAERTGQQVVLDRL